MAGEQITTDGQVEWNGLLMGPGTDYDLITISGWLGAPGSDRVTINRPGRHGGLPGQLRATERVINAEFAFGGELLTASFAQVRDVMAMAFAWNENPVEQELVVRMNGLATVVNARVINFDMPTVTSTYNQGEGFASVQWVATDPKRYGTSLKTYSTELPPAIETGLSFELAFPLSFGEDVEVGGSMVLVNNGNAHAWPVWEVIGPITGPVITCQETGNVLQFDTDFEIADGQVLRIDTDTGTVTLGGVNRRTELAEAEWFSIPPRSSGKEVRFTASGGTGTLVGYVRDAYFI